MPIATILKRQHVAKAGSVHYDIASLVVALYGTLDANNALAALHRATLRSVLALHHAKAAKAAHFVTPVLAASTHVVIAAARCTAFASYAYDRPVPLTTSVTIRNLDVPPKGTA